MAELQDGEDFDFRMGDTDLDWLDFTNSIIERADALGLRLQSNPTSEDIEEAKRFLGIEERGRFIQDPTTGRLEGSEPGPGHDGGEGGGESAGKVSAGKLNDDEKTQIKQWTGNGYRDLRTDSRFGKTLEKLPVTTGVFYRGTRVTSQTLAKLQVGKYYKMGKFSSSSDHATIAKAFMEAQRHSSEKDQQVMFAVRGSGRKLPKEIDGESLATDEREIVLETGTEYKIDNVEKEEDDDFGEYYRVTLSEIKK